MIDCGSLEYAQSRVLARHGQRAGELDWQRLETVRELAALLEVARLTPLAHWLAGIAAPAPPHRIEIALRTQWRNAVDEVARWMPLPWQAGLRWCAVLADLPVLQHLAQGGEALAWMHDDPDYRALAAVPLAQRRDALVPGPFAALARAWPAPESLARAWHAEWLRRLPQRPAVGDGMLARLAAAVQAHAAAFAGPGAAGQGWLLRRALQARLRLLLRRAGGGPALAFIHLGLTALELERLRAELLGRAWFARAAAPRGG